MSRPLFDSLRERDATCGTVTPTDIREVGGENGSGFAIAGTVRLDGRTDPCWVEGSPWCPLTAAEVVAAWRRLTGRPLPHVLGLEQSTAESEAMAL